MEKLSHLGFWTIQRKLAIFALVLLILPLVSLGFLRQIESVLVDNLQDSLKSYARIISNAIAASNLENSSFALTEISPVGDKKLYVPITRFDLTVDGYADDWVEQKGFELSFFESQTATNNIGKVSSTNSTVALKNRKVDGNFSMQATSNGKDFYLFVDVFDSSVVYRSEVSQLSQSDQVLVHLENAQSESVTLRFAPVAVGKVRPSIESNGIQNFWLSESSWQESPTGYGLELRIPNRFQWRKVGVDVIDFDSNVKEAVTIKSYDKRLNELLWPDRALQSLIDGFSVTAGKRVWILDRNAEVRARTGSLMANLNLQPINPVIHFFLAPPKDEIIDARAKAVQFDTPLLNRALSGEPASGLEVSAGSNTAIALAAHPVRLGDTVVGAVLIEQTVASVQVLQREAMNIYVNTVLAVMLLVIIVLMFFAVRFASRVSQLSRQTTQAVDEYGRVKQLIKPASKNDELGQLTNSFASMTARLKDYNEYLEKLASRLTHEIRTPLAIVRSSLDNLSMQQQLAQDPMLQHAQQGIDRLSQLISRMREAARVEQSILTVELQPLELEPFLAEYCAASQAMYSKHQLLISSFQPDSGTKLTLIKQGDANQTSTLISGSEELLAQMLDKLLSNASDFAIPDSTIEILIEVRSSSVSLAVANVGPPLPDKTEQELFSLMTSERTESQRSDKQSHLGLGLYIVRLIAEHHNATYFARNWHSSCQQTGVIIGVELPILVR